MKPTHKPNLGELLRAATPVPERPAADFWEDFRARAALVPQAEPTRAPSPATRWLVATAALAAIIMLVFAVAQLRPEADSGSVLVAKLPPPARTDGLSRIEDVQVFLDNASVTIIEDSENGGTVLFVDAAPLPNRT